MIFKIGALGKFVKFTGKHLCRGDYFNKVAGFQPATLLRKRSQCSPTLRVIESYMHRVLPALVPQMPCALCTIIIMYYFSLRFYLFNVEILKYLPINISLYNLIYTAPSATIDACISIG